MSFEVVETALTFDDVLLRPAFSDFVPAEADLTARLARGVELAIPLLSAAMDRVTEARMAMALARLGGLGVIHKNMPVARQVAEVRAVKESSPDSDWRPALDRQGRLLVAAAVGVGSEALDRARALVAGGADAVVVDTAHGHSRGVIDTVQALRQAFPDMVIIAGNVATGEGALALAEAGADVIKVGVGPGSICTTRIVAGVGVPQVTAIADCARAVADLDATVIADGGIKHSGDIVKAIAAGAHTVMIGSLFAGTEESPGEVVQQGGRRFKEYRGMGSLAAMAQGSSDRYSQDGVDVAKLVPEGVEATVPYKGAVAEVVHQLLGGLRAGMGYTGCRTLDALRTRARFVRLTASGLRESHVHDVQLAVQPPNYAPPSPQVAPSEKRSEVPVTSDGGEPRS